MNVNLLSFSNFFQRETRVMHYLMHVTGFASCIQNLFPTSVKMFEEAVRAETGLASDSGSRNIRLSLATNEYLKPFAVNTQSGKQISICTLNIALAFLIFSNHELRTRFNARVQSGTNVPTVTQIIETNIRETTNLQTQVFFSNDQSLAYPEFVNTILDVQYLLQDANAFNYAVSVLTGTYYGSSYLRFIEHTSYQPHSFRTENCFSSALTFVFGKDSGLQMKHYPFSTMKMVNSMVDPTITDAFIALFSGLTIVDEKGNKPTTGSLSTYFKIYLSQSNYFTYLFTSCFSNVTGLYCNPDSRPAKNNNLKRNNKAQLQPDSSEQIAMMTTTSQKVEKSYNYEYYKFMNNLYAVNQHWFAAQYRMARPSLHKSRVSSKTLASSS